MGLLKRTKSQRVKAPSENNHIEEPPVQLPTDPRLDAAQSKRKSRLERGQSLFRYQNPATEWKPDSERPPPATDPTVKAGGLHTLRETVENQEGGDIFNFPTPSLRPSPRPSPRLPSSATFQPTSASVAGDNTGLIGVALGSPRQPPPQTGRSYTTGHFPRNDMERRPSPTRAQTETTALPQFPSPPVEPATPGPQRKKSAWESLSSLFRSRQSKAGEREPCEKVQASALPAAQANPLLDTPESSPGVSRIPGSTSVPRSRSPPLSRNKARLEARAKADKSSFLPFSEERAHRSPPKAFTTKHESASPPTPDAIPRTPRLDLDIPDAEMERYSVMFEKLLEPRQSILERRQSKAAGMKPGTEDNANALTLNKTLPNEPVTARNKVPQRSATSPHANRVPSLRVKVGKESQMAATGPATAIHQRQTIKRSQTAPTCAASPVALESTRRKAPTCSSTESERSPISPLPSEDSLPQTPTTATSVTDSDSITPSFHEPSHARTLPSKGPDPDDEPATAKAVPAPAQQTRREPYPRITSPEEFDRSIVQVSVARQVSVSRARAQVQQAASTTKQPLRPRVVELPKNRKSTMVVIESSDE